MRNQSEVKLVLLTLLHLLTDGVCGAVLAGYALSEPYYEPIVYWFMVYTILAFGLQGPTGLLLDKYPVLIRSGLLISAGLLFVGCFSVLPICYRIIFVGLGNCLFHVSGGIIVLRMTAGFKEPGLFVAGGAIGLALGLCSILGVWVLVVVDLLITLVIWRMLADGQEWDACCPDNFLFDVDVSVMWRSICLGLLLGCIVLRGFSGGNGFPVPLLTVPFVMAVGKYCGGLSADRFGWRRTVLGIFIVSFLSLQFSGIVAWLVFLFACNMTMPLTLRLAHRCFGNSPGFMFGLAASALVPGAVFKGIMVCPPQLIAALQFIILVVCGKKLLGRRGENAGM